MAPYSMDLRSRVLRDSDAGMPSKDVATKYAVSRIHEVADASEMYLAQNPNYAQVLAHHTRPQDAGKVFETVKLEGPFIRGVAVQDLVKRTL